MKSVFVLSGKASQVFKTLALAAKQRGSKTLGELK